MKTQAIPPRLRFVDTATGRALVDGKVYTYVAGTVTPTTTWTDSTGNTANTNPIILDERGEADIWLGDGLYKFILQDSAGNQIDVTDNISNNSLASLAATTGAALVGYGSATVADVITLNLRKFGGSPGASGSVNTQAFIDALAEKDSQGVKAIIEIGAGAWTFAGTANADGIVDGWYIPYRGFTSATGAVEIRGHGRATQILAGTNNMIQCRWSDCFGGVSGVTFDANGKTGVKALYVGHDDSSMTSLTVGAAAQTQEHNDFDRIWVKGGHAVGFWLRPGPHAGGSDSQVLSNNFSKFYIKGATRSILLDDNAPDSVSPNVHSVGTSNRNTFTQFEVGQTGTEIGVEIRTGAQNMFSHGVINGVDTGVKTGVLIENTGNGSLANDLNYFDGVSCENNVTYDMNNANANTGVVFGFFNFVTKFTGTLPGLIIPSHGYVSFMPLRLPGITYGEGVSGFSSGSIGLTKDINDTSQPWAAYTSLVAGDFTNVAALSGFSTVRYKRLSHEVYLNWRMVFQATTGGARITIPAAKLAVVNSGLAPHADLISVASNNPIASVYAHNGTSISAAEAGFTSTGDLYVNAPSAGNWATGAASNILNIIVHYEAA